MDEKKEKLRKRDLALQALILKIKDLIDDFLKIHYPKTKPEKREKVGSV